MSKRQHSFFLINDKEKGEQMCKNKLKKISRQKNNLFQTVLLRNTLRYVQTSYFVYFPCEAQLSDFDKLVSRKKKHRPDISEDIENILCEMICLQPLISPMSDLLP